jgi:hypothetical protein
VHLGQLPLDVPVDVGRGAQVLLDPVDQLEPDPFALTGDLVLAAVRHVLGRVHVVDRAVVADGEPVPCGEVVGLLDATPKPREGVGALAQRRDRGPDACHEVFHVVGDLDAFRRGVVGRLTDPVARAAHGVELVGQPHERVAVRPERRGRRVQRFGAPLSNLTVGEGHRPYLLKSAAAACSLFW